MQQPSDMACTLACAAMRDVGRAAEFLVEAQIEAARFRLKIAEAALEDLHQMDHALSNVRDWTSLAAMQNLFMKTPSTHGAMAMQTWIDFVNNLQTAYLRQMTEWNDQMQRPMGQSSSSQLFAASADSLRSFFDSFSVVSIPNSEAKRKAPLRSASDANTAQAA